MNCQEALHLLYDIIDKEASEIDTKQVEEHLQRCHDCFEKYRLESEIHRFLHERVKVGNSEHAQEDLRSKILLKLDELDQNDPCGPTKDNKGNPRPFRLTATFMVAVAAVVTLAGAGFFGLRFHSHQSSFLPLEQSHWLMADATADIFTPTNSNLLLADAQQRFGYELQPTVGEFLLVSARQEHLMETDMLHYGYRAGDRRVSVFLAPAAWLDLVGQERMELIMHQNIPFFDHNCRGCRVVMHRAGNAVVITASSDRSVDLLDFVPGRVATAI